MCSFRPMMSFQELAGPAEDPVGVVREANREVALLHRLERLHQMLDLDAASRRQAVPFRDGHIGVERALGELGALPCPRPRDVEAFEGSGAGAGGGVRSRGAFFTRFPDPLRTPSAGDLVVMVPPGPATCMPWSPQAFHAACAETTTQMCHTRHSCHARCRKAARPTHTVRGPEDRLGARSLRPSSAAAGAAKRG